MMYFIAIFFFFKAFAQNNTISGFIRDSKSRESLIAVSIFLENTRIGTSTNIDGYYVITDIPNGKYVIHVKYLGYKTFKKKIHLLSDKIKLDILLEKDVYEGDVVEVIAKKEPINVLFDSPISKIVISNLTLSQIPQIGESDLLRSLQTLPGVLPISDFSSALYIRGGTPDQNLYLIDGADVYNPEHFFGLFSTFNTDAIKSVELLKGGFSANYGGRLSSVLDVINYEGNRNNFESKVSLSILAAKATVQFPLSKRTSISASFRRTYFDIVLGDAIPDLPRYYFYDGNIKLFFDINDKNTLSFSVFSGKDDFNLDKVEKGIHYDWGNMTSSLKWTHIFTPSLFSNFWFTTSRYKSNFNLDEFVTEMNQITDFTVKGSLEYQLNQSFFLKMGFEQKFVDGSYTQSTSNAEISILQTPRQFVLYNSAEWQSTSDLLMELGFRYTRFKNHRIFTSLEPRFSAKYRLDRNKNIKFSSGFFSQFLQRIPRTFFTDIWTASDIYQDKSTSKHYILAYQQVFNGGEYNIEGEIYYKSYDKIYRFNRFLHNIIPSSYTNTGKAAHTTTKGLFDEGGGESTGLEILLRKRKGNLTGWVGYTFASTWYQFNGVNQNNPYPPRHDRRHIINLVLNWNFTRWLNNDSNSNQKIEKDEWVFGINYVYSSGQPLTVLGSLYRTNSIPGTTEKNNNRYHLAPTSINSYRLPVYTRMDLSIKYKVKYSSFTMIPYLQIFNIGDRKNVWFLQYRGLENQNTRFKTETTNMFPLLPTLGVNFEF